MVKYVLDCYAADYIISDGERPIRHKTNYQEYLCKYFGFRFAYCKLHIKYKLWFKIIIIILFLFSKLLLFISEKINSKQLYNVICILKQEKIRRTFL
jgi:hypothetical protein